MVLSCLSDQECIEFNAYYLCVENGEGVEVEGAIPERICEHKPLWPLTAKEWIGTFIFGFIMLLSNVGGIGGGGVAIPIAMYAFNLSLKNSIALSSLSILFATVARFVQNYGERHPLKESMPSIDYYLTNTMMPLTLIGSLVGAYIYKSFPDLVLIICLTIILVMLTLLSGSKFRQIYKKESEAAAKAAKVAQDHQEKEGTSELNPGSKSDQPTTEVELTKIVTTAEKAGGDDTVLKN